MWAAPSSTISSRNSSAWGLAPMAASVLVASISSAARCRLGSRPWGRKIIIRTRARPNRKNRYSVMSLAELPVMLFRNRSRLSPPAASRRYSGRKPTAKAPAMTPGVEPRPPSTMAARIRKERFKGKVSGLMNPTLEA